MSSLNNAEDVQVVGGVVSVEVQLTFRIFLI